MRRMAACVLLLLLAAVWIPQAAAAIPAPENLTALGDRGSIALQWSGGSGDFTGYNIYRGTDGVLFKKIGGVKKTATSYEDKDVKDGELYFYYVAAAKDKDESGRSNTVHTMPGIRLAAANPGTLELNDGRVYVADSLVAIEGNLNINNQSKLYVIDGGILDLLEGKNIVVDAGLFSAESFDPAHRAKLTAHASGGGPLGDGAGFGIYFQADAEDYNPKNGTGCVIRNAVLENFCQSDAIKIDACRVGIFNSRLSSTRTTGGSYIKVTGAGGIRMEHCVVNRIVFSVVTDLRSSQTLVEHNVFTGGYYAVSFFNATGPILNEGQVRENSFDCTGRSGTLYLYRCQGTGILPLGNNYWSGGQGTPPRPMVKSMESTIVPDLDTPSPGPLSAPPAGIGPDW